MESMEDEMESMEDEMESMEAEMESNEDEMESNEDEKDEASAEESDQALKANSRIYAEFRDQGDMDQDQELDEALGALKEDQATPKAATDDKAKA